MSAILLCAYCQYTHTHKCIYKLILYPAMVLKLLFLESLVKFLELSPI